MTCVKFFSSVISHWLLAFLSMLEDSNASLHQKLGTRCVSVKIHGVREEEEDGEVSSSPPCNYLPGF